jgi:hypothetical protein
MAHRGFLHAAAFAALPVVFAAAQCPNPQPTPAAVTFFILPEGGVAPPPESGYAPGDESKLRVTLSPFGTPVDYVFDFAEDQRIDRNGYVSLIRPAACLPAPSGPAGVALPVVDFRLRGRDLQNGVDILLTPSTSGPPGTWATSAVSCTFPIGATITAALACDVSVSDPALAPFFPTSAVLSLQGTTVPGNYHQIVLLSGGLSGLSATSFKLHMKQDLHDGCITWREVAIAGLSTGRRAGDASDSALNGSFGLRRDPYTWTTYDLVDLSMTLDSTPQVAVVGTSGIGGTITLDAATRTISGTLTWTIDGVAVVRTLDGIGDVFEGPPTMPTEIRIAESGMGALAQLSFVGEKPGVRPKLNDFEIGATTELLVRARPGDLYVIAASNNPVPGINSPLGDVFVSLDAMFWFTLDPANGYVFNNGGVAAPDGTATLSVVLPNMPSLVGFTTYFAGATLHGGTFALFTNTNVYRATIR